MFEDMIRPASLFLAWELFRKGKNARPDVQLFARHLEDSIFGLHDDLASGAYHHGLYHRFHVFDPKHRIIHKATVRDRVVHHAVYRVLLPMFERSFIFDSYSCRDEKGTHAAVRRLEGFARKVSKNFTGDCWALQFDIRKFFDSVDHEILLGVLEKTIAKATGHHELGYRQTMSLLAKIVGSYECSEKNRGGVTL